MPFLLVSSGTRRRRPVMVRTMPDVARVGERAVDVRAHARVAGEVGVDELLRGLLGDADVLGQREGGLAVEQRVVDDLRAPPQLVRVQSARRAEHALGRPVVNVHALPEGLDERRVARRGARARAVRSASSRRRSGRDPGSATNAARISRPSGVRIGMFCRFGSLLLSRPVAATAWLNVVCTRPVAGLTSAGSASTYVPLSFWMLRHFSTRPGSSCVCASSSSTSCAVETTRVLPVFLPACRFSFTKRTSASCFGELMLNSPPACRKICRAQLVEVCLHAAREGAEHRGVHLHAGLLDRGQHGNQRRFQIAVDVGEALLLQVVLERRGDGERQFGALAGERGQRLGGHGTQRRRPSRPCR